MPNPPCNESSARRRWVVMGVSGTGKTTVARALALRLGARLIEGDDYHPPRNIEKMRAGIALGDADRHAWLLKLRDLLAEAHRAGEGAVLACSALKRRYRDILREADPGLVFVHLTGACELIAERMRHRGGHYMPVALLDSQLRDLESLQPDEAGAEFDVAAPPERLVEQILARLP